MLKSKTVLFIQFIGLMIFSGPVFAEEKVVSTETVKTKIVCSNETDTKSLRHTLLTGDTTNSVEVVRLDLDKDGDPDIIERWWNGKRVRWFDENDDMKNTDSAGDPAGDCVQVDRDSDGFYDGPNDMNIKWVDDDNDGDADVQVIGINPNINSGRSQVYMIFVDEDDDNVHGYIDWQTFDFPCWRFTGTTNFSPDYNGDSVFLKMHSPPFNISDPRYNWENPFAFFDTDKDGCTEMAIRFCDRPFSDPDSKLQQSKFDGKIEEAFIAYDLDNDAQKGNEMDYDMSLRFSGGEMLDYNQYVNKHPTLKAPDWVLPYFRFTNWREIDELIYVPHNQCHEQIFKPKWGDAYLVFDEDDDDHRWERVEMYYPGDPYSTARWGKGKKNGGLCGHVQSDTLGDRGEFDTDFSGSGKLYIGKWDNKIHLSGAEWGAWTVDYKAEYWGSHPVTGNSSPKKAEKVTEVVHYKDTDNNGFFDEISYDYDGDKNIDLTISLLDYEGKDVGKLIVPVDKKWEGMHELFNKIATDSWREAVSIYRAVWKKGLNTAELDDLAIASSTGEKYNNAYWLKEKVFRMLYQKTQSKEIKRLLCQYYFTGDIDKLIDFISNTH